MNIPQDLQYTSSHEWIKIEDKEATIGITEYAQSEISDVVYVELPEIGKEVKAGEVLCVIESVKAAFDIYAPVDGKVSAINQAVEDDPAIVNSSPYIDGWLYKLDNINIAKPELLMNASSYKDELDK